jgi:hypothetical protein
MPDEPRVWQSQRGALYQQRWIKLTHAITPTPVPVRARTSKCPGRAGHAAGTFTNWCTPAPAATAPRGPAPARTAWRLRVPAGTVHWVDRRLGPQHQDVAAEVGDFVLRAPTGCGPTSWPWWWTMPSKASPTWCAAKTWPTTPHARSCCSARWACPTRLPACAPGAGRQRRKAVQAKRCAGAGPGRPAGRAERRRQTYWACPCASRHVPGALAQWVNEWPSGATPTIPLVTGRDQTSPALPHPPPVRPVAHPRTIRTFVRRAGRTTIGQAKAL